MQNTGIAAGGGACVTVGAEEAGEFRASASERERGSPYRPVPRDLKSEVTIEGNRAGARVPYEEMDPGSAFGPARVTGWKNKTRNARVLPLGTTKSPVREARSKGYAFLTLKAPA